MLLTVEVKITLSFITTGLCTRPLRLLFVSLSSSEDDPIIAVLRRAGLDDHTLSICCHHLQLVVLVPDLGVAHPVVAGGLTLNKISKILNIPCRYTGWPIGNARDTEQQVIRWSDLALLR